MNKLKIAVLDNGADEKILALCGLPDIIQQNKGNISDEEDLFLHGTNCAMIIGLNCADAELYSYKLYYQAVYNCIICLIIQEKEMWMI